MTTPATPQARFGGIHIHDDGQRSKVRIVSRDWPDLPVDALLYQGPDDPRPLPLPVSPVAVRAFCAWTESHPGKAVEGYLGPFRQRMEDDLRAFLHRPDGWWEKAFPSEGRARVRQAAAFLHANLLGQGISRRLAAMGAGTGAPRVRDEYSALDRDGVRRTGFTLQG